jgi:hypothetical protein
MTSCARDRGPRRILALPSMQGLVVRAGGDTRRETVPDASRDYSPSFAARPVPRRVTPADPRGCRQHARRRRAPAASWCGMPTRSVRVSLAPLRRRGVGSPPPFRTDGATCLRMRSCSRPVAARSGGVSAARHCQLTRRRSHTTAFRRVVHPVGTTLYRHGVDARCSCRCVSRRRSAPRLAVAFCRARWGPPFCPALEPGVPSRRLAARCAPAFRPTLAAALRPGVSTRVVPWRYAPR